MKQVSCLLRPTSWSLLLQDDGGDLYFEIATGDGSEALRGMRIPPNEGIAGAAFLTGEVQVVQESDHEIAHVRRFDAITKAKTRNVIALPLKARGRPLGVLQLVNAIDEPMRREDLQALKAIADYAAIAIENAQNFQRVQALTITDEHTGLYNARYLREVLAAEVERATRFHHPLALIFLDLDNFKAVNDSHGHLLGSALLSEVGELLVSGIRKVDTAFRYGGDEFAILLVETTATGAMVVARRLRERFDGKVFLRHHDLSVRITASIGVATFPEDAASAADLFHLADQAMYRAKALGRNEVASTNDIPKDTDTAKD
jgi:diguanylate cyclase (GGDEF)-like protein